MSQEEVRENNKLRVVEKALFCFSRDGIDHTKIRNIAREAGLTERSVFRYFPMKSDLVAAACYRYWDLVLKRTRNEIQQMKAPGMTGIEEIALALKHYSNLVFTDPAGIRFMLDAEIYLFREKQQDKVENRPPEKFETGTGPMVSAIRLGIADKSVDAGKNVKMLYYNAFDTLLGVMEHMSVDVFSTREVDSRKRMDALCGMIVREFSSDSSGCA